MKICFSLYGTEDKYYIGAEKNIVQIQDMLPDWTPVIFVHNKKTNLDRTVKLEAMGASIIDVSDITIGGMDSMHSPMFWRFIPFTEDAPAISRDLDSRFSHREVRYINDWLESKDSLFIIRDHPWHSQVPGGLIGMKNVGSKFSSHMEDFVSKNNAGAYNADQEFLSSFKSLIKNITSFYCGFDDKTNYIPRDDKDFFIGMQVDEFDKPLSPSATVALDFLKELNL